jgi:peroxisomal trans-2-enoyl-CoA reductase
MSIYRAGLFAGKVAIVTGGGSGIGRAIAEELCSLGCSVAVCARKEERLREAARDLNARYAGSGNEGGACRAYGCNIRRTEDVKRTVRCVLDDFGRLDFLVNNAGGQFISAAEDITDKGWNAVIDTNLTGTFKMSRECFASMRDNTGGGAVVNIIADVRCGFPMMSHTGAARAGVENLTRTLSLEWADSGVRINAVAPGVVFSKSAAKNYEGSAIPDILQSAAAVVPFRRLGTPAEVSSAVCFLLSPGAAYVSGATLAVDGASSLSGATRQMRPIADHMRMPAYDWGVGSRL